MINFLSNWIEGIAIAVIIASIFEMILPNGNIKKYVKLILGVYIMFSVISPFVDSNALYSIDIPDTLDVYSENINNSITENKDINNNNLEEMYISTFEKDIIEFIEEQGFNVSQCSVDAILDTENENAGINKITIVLVSKNNDFNSNDNNEQTTSSNIQEIDKVEININNISNYSNEEQATITSKDIKNLTEQLSDYYEIDKNIIDIKIY